MINWEGLPPVQLKKPVKTDTGVGRLIVRLRHAFCDSASCMTAFSSCAGLLHTQEGCANSVSVNYP